MEGAAPAPETETPEAPAEDASGAVAEQAAVPSNGTEVDLDGDGFSDAITYDLDGDGRVDQEHRDTDGDGYTDEAIIDTDYDGIGDVLATNTDGDLA